MPSPIPDRTSGWQFPNRELRLTDIVSETGALLSAVAHRLGKANDSAILIDGLRAVLSLSGRESALPVAAHVGEPGLRGDLARQASAIGEAIIALVRQHHAEQMSSDSLEIRSPCEGHVWTPAVANLLMGPAGGPQVMQLYNEWQHQLVLARDALLPYANWQDVPIPLDRLAAKGGLRALEASRKLLAADMLTGRVPQDILIAHALAMQGEAYDGSCYGFQTDAGLALPAFLECSADSGLLTWHTARLIDRQAGDCARFLHADVRYFDAERSLIKPGQASPLVAVISTNAAIGAHAAGLALSVTIDDREYRKDVGRIARGHRFAIRQDGPVGPDPRAGEAPIWHDARTVLGYDTLVTAEGGVHVIPGDTGTTLALLGTLYPENVIVAKGESLATLRGYGKGFGPLFVIGDVRP